MNDVYGNRKRNEEENCHQMDWYNGNALDPRSGGAGLESQPVHRLT